MKRFFTFIAVCLLASSMWAKTVTPSASLPTYYESIQGKSGKALFDAVQKVTKQGYSSLGYDGLWSAYEYTDLRSDGSVWDMYSDCTWKSLSSKRCVVIVMNAIASIVNTPFLNHGMVIRRVDLVVISSTWYLLTVRLTACVATIHLVR